MIGILKDIVDEEFVARTHDAAVRWIEADGQRGKLTYGDSPTRGSRRSSRVSISAMTRRVARIDARLEHEHHPNMVRLLTGQRRNLDRRHGRKRHEIESRARVAVGYDTLAAGILEVVGLPLARQKPPENNVALDASLSIVPPGPSRVSISRSSKPLRLYQGRRTSSHRSIYPGSSTLPQCSQ